MVDNRGPHSLLACDIWYLLSGIQGFQDGFNGNGSDQDKSGEALRLVILQAGYPHQRWTLWTITMVGSQELIAHEKLLMRQALSSRNARAQTEMKYKEIHKNIPIDNYWILEFSLFLMHLLNGVFKVVNSNKHTNHHE